MARRVLGTNRDPRARRACRTMGPICHISNDDDVADARGKDSDGDADVDEYIDDRTGVHGGYSTYGDENVY